MPQIGQEKITRKIQSAATLKNNTESISKYYFLTI